ncbi:SGNH/GDSL hydrolase family protein [Spirillospora sp. NPDC047279]|uniref:SGNH/GDSL hydrolase family protein n=1 Tax=Spirillospora sp. NPDC047279 TaxID=3155478 RepID=UPI003406B152
MSSRRARRGAAILSLCLGVLPVSACGGTPVKREASQARGGVTAAPVVMVLGDSYTVGEKGSQPEATYAPAAARLLGWQVVAAGKAGTGYVATGSRRYGLPGPGQTFLALFESQLGWRPAPDLLILSGGHNDRRYPTAQTAQGARDLLARARQRWPGTKILMIGPMWGNDTPPVTTLAVRDTLRAVAQEQKVPFVDPIGERWITGNRAAGTGNASSYIRPDGVHPTVEGHRYVASRLVDDIRRFDLARPARSS